MCLMQAVEVLQKRVEAHHLQLVHLITVVMVVQLHKMVMHQEVEVALMGVHGITLPVVMVLRVALL
ncbi:MAG: hypothetical protein CBC55_03995 [Gammaproteobacteria bacterium TMED95]|nr:MAG: hypothetical protein CBC55_03995 [Gammaproteobacteria bacterium TMED95]